VRFRNTAPHALSFRIDGTAYHCDVEGEVDILARHSLGVKGRGLPLESLDGDPAAQFREREEAEGAPTDAAGRLWFDRAHEVKRALEKAEARHAAALADAHDQMDAAATAHAEAVALLESELAGVRARLGLGAEESILGALDMLLGAPPPPPEAPVPVKPTKPAKP
jgi:hypothetical protein